MKRLSGLAALLLMAICVTGLTAGPANAGSFLIRQCEYPGSISGIRGGVTDSSLGSFSSNPANAFSFENVCTASYYDGYTLSFKPRTYSQGDIARVKFSAPVGIGITAVDGYNYSTFNPPYSDGWQVRDVLHTNGTGGVAWDVPTAITHFSHSLPSGQIRQDFEMNLKCTTTTCPGGSPFSDLTRLATVQLTVEDSTVPDVVSSTGTLYAGGVVSGSRTVGVVAGDGESGVWRVIVMVNGQLLGYKDNPGASAGVSCDPSAPTYNSYRPCKATFVNTWTVNTASAPFKNGANSVFACATDYSGESECTDATTVYVSN